MKKFKASYLRADGSRFTFDIEASNIFYAREEAKRYCDIIPGICLTSVK